MDNAVRFSIAAIFLVFCVALIVLLGVNVYNTYFGSEGNAAAKAELVRQSNIKACQKGLAKSLIVEGFMLEAAQARRAAAAAEFSRGETVSAQNDLSAARGYEKDAAKYDNLTIKDCEAAYPQK